jgi:hypothetical protein
MGFGVLAVGGIFLGKCNSVKLCYCIVICLGPWNVMFSQLIRPTLNQLNFERSTFLPTFFRYTTLHWIHLVNSLQKSFINNLFIFFLWHKSATSGLCCQYLPQICYIPVRQSSFWTWWPCVVVTGLVSSLWNMDIASLPVTPLDDRHRSSVLQNKFTSILFLLCYSWWYIRPL